MPTLLETLVTLSAGAGLAYGQQVLSRHLTRKDRKEEREHAAVEKHRADLRLAYATFVQAAASFLISGTTYLGLTGALEEARNGPEAAESDLSPLHDRVRLATEDLFATATAVEGPAAMVLLLETVAHRREIVESIALRDMVLPDDPGATREQSAADFQLRRARFKALLAELYGEFAPSSRSAKAARTGG